MLRLLVLALLLANGVFLAWSQGWLAPTWPPPRHSEREPERLGAQVRPEAVRLLPAGAASAAVSAAVSAARAAALVCLEAGPLSAADLPAAEAALAAAQLAPGSWAAEPGPAAPQWLVYAGRYAEAGARRARRDELTRLGLAAEPLSEPPELAPGLVISRHTSPEAADAALDAVTRGTTLRGARVVELPAPPPPLWLRVPQADPATAARLQALPAAGLAGGFRPCAGT